MTEMSKSYADALFSLAMETNTVYETLVTLKELCEGLNATEGALDLLASPSIPKDERCAVLEKAFGDVQPEHVLSFVGVLVQHGHIRELTSAVELTKAEQEALTEKLGKKLGRTIHLECTVDPSLLGGLVVNVDGKVIDGSLKHKLQEIKEVMTK